MGQTPLTAAVRSGTQAVADYGSFRYPEEEAYRKALREVTEREPFAYDMEADPLYRQYAEQYRREGDRATEDTLGRVSARTGGLASSYAVTAARQAEDRYLRELNDAALRLYQQAYSRYRQEGQDRLTALNALAADRDRAYREWTGDYDRLRSGLGTLERQEETAYSRYLDALQREAAERKYGDSLARQAEQDALSREKQAAQTALNLAKLGAGYGDYSGLEALGISPSDGTLYDTALAKAGRVTPVGSGSGSGSGGSAKPGTSTVNSAYRSYLTGDRSELTLGILRAAGLLPEETAEDGTEPSEAGGAALLDPEDPASLRSREAARDWLLRRGVPASLAGRVPEESEWARAKAENPGSDEAQYDSYGAFLADYVRYLLDKARGDGA